MWLQEWLPEFQQTALIVLCAGRIANMVLPCEFMWEWLLRSRSLKSLPVCAASWAENGPAGTQEGPSHAVHRNGEGDPEPTELWPLLQGSSALQEDRRLPCHVVSNELPLSRGWEKACFVTRYDDFLSIFVRRDLYFLLHLSISEVGVLNLRYRSIGMIVISIHHLISPDHTEDLLNLIIICQFAPWQAWKKITFHGSCCYFKLCLKVA